MGISFRQICVSTFEYFLVVTARPIFIRGFLSSIPGGVCRFMLEFQIFIEKHAIFRIMDLELFAINSASLYLLWTFFFPNWGSADPSPQKKWPYLYGRFPLCWNKWKINFPSFAIFSLWDMVASTMSMHPKKISSQKIRNVLKRIFDLVIFFFRFLVFEIWSILYSTFVVHWGLEEIFANPIQKR